MPLSPARTRLFVIGFVAMMLGLSVFAAIVITRGWRNAPLQQEVGRIEAESKANQPRL